MEMLAALSRMDDGNEDDYDSRRPTPLDPEYWRGITHSRESPHAPQTPYDAFPVAHAYGGAVHAAPYAHPAVGGYGGAVYQQPAIQRPMTAPSMGVNDGYYGGGGGLVTSPIHYQSTRTLPVSPVAHAEPLYVSRVEARHPMSTSMDWTSVAPPAGMSVSPQVLKVELRDAFVRAQCFADLLSLFRSYDPVMAGTIPLHAVQDALAMVGLVIPGHVVQAVAHHFGQHGGGMIDYSALVRFLELDAHEWEQLRAIVAGGRLNSHGRPDIGQIFAQSDTTRSGYLPRAMFVAILRQNGVMLPDGAMHFLLLQLAKPFDSMSVSYTRFMDLAGLGSTHNGWSSPIHSQAHGAHFQRADARLSQTSHDQHSGSFDPPFATPTIQRRGSFVDFTTPRVEVSLPRHGWICRVCAHQQVEDWVTNCEVCETSKPKTGKYGGFVKCSHCKFDNNFDMDDCEMCGRPLNTGSRKSRADRKSKRKPSRSHSSSSRSSSSSDSSNSSSRSRRSSRSARRKSERRVRTPSKLSKSPRRPRFQRGEEIQAIPVGERDFEIGVIARVRSDGTYDIEFDNGQYEKNVDERCVRNISRAQVIRAEGLQEERKSSRTQVHDDNGPDYEEGDRIEAQFRGGDRFFPGIIQRKRADGTYDILYDDSEVEMKVRGKFMRKLKPKSPSKPSSPSRPAVRKSADGGTDTSSSDAGFSKGQKVEAKLKGSAGYVKGAIFRANPDGTYDVEFDTGELEKHVPSTCIRLRSGHSPVKKPLVQSDDEPIRPKRPVTSTPKKPTADSSSESAAKSTRKYREGQRVDVRFKGGDRYFPGVVSRARLNGTYDIEYDDGEKETGVKADFVRPQESSSPSKKPPPVDSSDSDVKSRAKFTVGQKVEAKYKGKDKFYPGVIARVRLAGKYDVDYDDGEKETGVDGNLIRAKPSSPPKAKPPTTSEDEFAEKKFKIGQPVEAQFKGKERYYPGVISRARSNGTYDIEYDDGEKELEVKSKYIREKTGKKSPAKKPATETSESDSKPAKKFKQGDKIEAQYKGKSKFYPGVISRCRLNGTYDIDYDDGEKETGVAAELIRLKEGSSPSKKKPAEESEDDRQSKKKFKEGEKVEAQYKGKSKFYPGVISRCRLNGTYDIDYDDGEKETGVAAELIRSRDGGGSGGGGGSDKKKLREGDKVEAQYKGKSKFYPGVIARCRLNGTYDIDYDDGEKETGVAAELIRLRGSSSDSEEKQPKKLREGDKVEAQYKGKSKFYPGVISRCRLNGTYDIDYDDGEKETGVAAELIRLRGGSSPGKKKPADDSEDDRKPKKLREGDKVEAQYKGKSKFYPGVISRCRLNGTYDIDYDDGEKETGVAAELIRLRGGSSSPSKSKRQDDTSEDDRKGSKKFREGERVEAQYKGKSKFYPGVISRCRLNGTYDIDYDDGEKETGVAAELIRSKESSKSPAKKKPAEDSEDDRKGKKKFKEGEKVEAQYKGKSKFYPGVISRCRLNGTYDVDYDDGEKETGVAAELIRSKESSSPTKKKSDESSEDDRKPKKLREGDKVEAQYKGKSKFYPGVISRCRLNGTYDIDYDDGEKETGVAPELIRLRESSSPSKKKPPADSSEDDGRGAKKFKENEKVEAQYKGKSKFYPGVISRCRLNGTYDIDYDDGEKETGVAAELIRSLEKKSSKDGGGDDGRGSKKFREGDKVEAQYKGKSKYYPGVISRCRLNGTYDIDYDDGEKETGVAAELIRARESSSGSGSKKLREGDKVEAQYKGKSKFYPGVISRCRLNGTYDIDYDDGEKETGVAAELIRLKEGSSPSKKKPAEESEDDRQSKKKFKEGEKVEAQYKGKSKFYPGVISRCRLNGTYDIDYDDGEKETGVAAELIRSRDGGGSGGGGGSDKKKLREGDKVEAQYKGKSKFYPGVIARCRLNGTYDIDYDDGEKETGVAAELIRLRGSSSDSEEKQPKKLREGDKVEAQYKGKSKFYPGVISRCRLNGTYDIDYDDGEKETGVAAELIRLRGGSSPGKKKPADDSEDDRKPKKLREGDKVEAQYKGKSKFYPGVISRCRLNGTYDIDYDDGEKETGVAAELIRLRGGSSSPSKSKRQDDTSEDDRKGSKKFREGERVEAQYKGKSKFYPGVISRCRLNGTYDIDYDDGEKETGVAAELIRSKESSKSPAKKKPAEDSEDDRKGKKKFKEGEKVEAQYKGKSKFYPGVISRCRLNGTYDVDYDDGEKETGVAAELIRSKESSSPTKKKSDESSEDDRKPKKLREGDKVEAQYKGKSKFYPGVISRCRLNGTYDIDYDDGEKETGVAPELIRLRESSSPSKKKPPADSSEDEGRGAKKFKENEKVEAQYKGKSKFYPGVISRCRLNGTYDIDYDDGEKETGVAAELIRSLEKKSSKDGGGDDGRGSKKFREGDKVEAQYKGKSKYYPGVISRCRLNGTYDIDYDDGEKETGVAAELIRARESSSGSGSKKLREGDKVEAQYKGKSKFYPGVISRCRLNGTYDIDYDDGEKETGVAAELIRLKEGSSPSKKKPAEESEDDRQSKKKFKEGEKVEAQYKGKSKFYPGVISRCRLNGTYDIDYDDGEKETGVAAELIRSRDGGGSGGGGGSDKKKLREGDKVEAQYKGKSKFYPGVIARCRLNGTYDIDYDDGEKETGVAAELIRLRGSSSDSEEKQPKKLREGDKVEAQYKGKSKFYPGVISRCRLNGTYDIDYDDGEKETGVAAELIRLRGGSSPGKKKPADDSEDDRKPKKLREGDKVEAQYKGKSKFYPGVISRCRLNGTYDIDYDDGEKETGVAAELIRLRGGSSSPSKSKRQDDTSEDDRKGSKKFREGEKVEAQYKGKSKFYPGVISRCRLNGTYDIDYDDGEKETGVAAELIRSKESSKSPVRARSGDDSDTLRGSTQRADSSSSFRVGTRVEALYHGKDKYFKGTISRANADGTYDVEYDDGDKENRVPARNIRALKTSNFSATAEFSSSRPSRPSASAGGRRRSGNSSD